MAIRPATPDDLPAVARLRPASFRRSLQPSEAHLVRYLDEVFFGNPWVDPELPSLVYEQAGAGITGFLGVIPRPWRVGGTRLRGAAGTQLMVAPEHRGLAGIQLLQHFMKGKQDLTFSDSANDAARTLWTKLGGAAPLTYSMQWRVPMRRMSNAVRGRVAPAGVIGRIARPAFALVDSLAPASILRAAEPRAEARIVSPAEYLAVSAAAAGDDLRPDYSAASLGWLLGKVREKTGIEPRLVAFEGDRGPACCAFLVNQDGIAQVLALSIGNRHPLPVLRSLARLAHDHGAIVLEGRVDGHLGPALEGAGARIAREGPWTLTHAASCEVRLLLEGGRARASRLDGEWWTAF